MVIISCLEDIRRAAKETPAELYTRCVRQRLDLALASYYSDLSSKLEFMENKSESNPARMMRKLIK